MDIVIKDEQKLVEVWLSNSEKHNSQIRSALNNVYADYSRKKYMVAVFESGKTDLYSNTMNLLKYNKARKAKMATA